VSQDDIAAEIGTDPAVDDTGAAGSESYHGYSVDDETQPQSTGDSLVDSDRGLADPLDEGFSPPEKPSAAQGFGNTPLEESIGETLDQRVAQEVPEPDPYEEAEATPVEQIEDPAAEPFEPAVFREVGDERSGRLVEPDEGVRDDVDPEATATDVGIDGAGAGAEEAAMHELPDDAVP
jgi:hypothetical protein